MAPVRELAAVQDWFASELRGCGRRREIERGREIHAQLHTSGYGGDRYLGNLLVQMYGECGCVEDAHAAFEAIHERNSFSWNIMLAAYARNGHLQETKEMFDRMPAKNVVTWNAMLAAYSQNGHAREALTLLRAMWQEGIRATEVTWICALDACGKLAGLAQGVQAYRLVKESGCESFKVSNAAITMFARCGAMGNARDVFESMPSVSRGLVTWTAMITAHGQCNEPREALLVFQIACLEGIKADGIAFVSVLGACGDEGNLAKGRAIHRLLDNATINRRDGHIDNALIAMYSKCGCLSEARRIFYRCCATGIATIGTWNSIISAFSRQSQLKSEAVRLFASMDLAGIPPDEITLISVTEACSSFDQLRHTALDDNQGLQKRGFKLRNALIAKCGECGSLETAELLFFDGDHDRGINNVVSWNALMAAFLSNRKERRALDLFKQMDLEGISPNSISLLIALDACARLLALDEGRTIHEHAVAISVAVHSPVKLATALITLYGRCGHVADAWSVFAGRTIAARENWNTYTWTAMMAALASGGQHGEAVNLFQRMGQEGFQPDLVALGINFLACSHAGMIDQARSCFASIDRDYGITASPELFVSMLDVLGRSGGVPEARELIESIPVGARADGWGALLGSCGIHGDSLTASLAAAGASSSSAYVQLASLYRQQL
ncbi:pentatricopeptide repeat-containing protein At2g13600 [Selaginella moellendorffii]|uniref:pentatricopeptide repeat-containing protein At2g13600 n=1 Tax=Selaginella moellendorffii TaxID=88036 RepID=UPI000D1C3EF0|nr:pentatricopeptide repeat-containing protein At2g13600 [Selaginella moellendorffii]|eukprot:XP_024543459.1 pentatricopeptide repeat-containing protein At2g13600 [Selaginella moellendorffii]